MRILEFVVTGQCIQKSPTCDFSGLVMGTEDYLKARFIFDHDWDNMDKIAVFYPYLGKQESAVPLTSNICNIPNEICSIGSFKVGVIGKDRNGAKINTDLVAVMQKWSSSYANR